MSGNYVDLYTALTHAMQALEDYDPKDRFERTTIKAAVEMLDSLRAGDIVHKDGLQPTSMDGWQDVNVIVPPEIEEGLRIFEAANLDPDEDRSLSKVISVAVGYCLQRHNCLIPPKE